MTRIFSVGLALFFLCANASAEEGIRVGFLGPLSGAWADWATSIKNGVELGIEDNKLPIKLIVEDDHCEPRQSVTAAIKLFSIEGVKLVIGPGCLMNVKAVAPIAEKYGAVLFGTGGLDRDVLERHASVVDVTTSVQSESKYLAAYIASRDDVRTISILHGTNAFGEELAGSLAEHLKAKGIRVLEKEHAEFSTNDFRALIPRLTKTAPDAIFVHQGESSTGIFVKQLRQSGYTGLLFGPYTVEAETVLKTAGPEALEGMMYTFSVNSAEGSAEKKEFDERYRELFGVAPTAHSRMVYDLVGFLGDAFDKCLGGDPKCVSEYIRGLGRVSGVAGDVSFHADGSADRPFGIKQVRGGQFEWVEEEINLTPPS